MTGHLLTFVTVPITGVRVMSVFHLYVVFCEHGHLMMICSHGGYCYVIWLLGHCHPMTL